MRQLYINTPLWESLEMGKVLGGQVHLKMEAFQPSGSFKIRGLGHLCCHYAEQEQPRCFISSSGGNAGLAVAYAGRRLGIPVTVIVPETSTSIVVDKIKQEQAEVTVHGHNWNEADKLARELAKEGGYYYIPPFDHPLIWEGHATIVHEIKATGIRPDAVILAVGGGGLLCGVAEGMQAVGWNDIPIITAETEGSSSFAQSVQAGKLVTLPEINTVATSLGAKTVTPQALEWTKRRPIIPFTVTDKEAVSATLKFADDHRTLVEPACGAALSLVYGQKIDPATFPLVVVIACGGNGVSRALLDQWQKKFSL